MQTIFLVIFVPNKQDIMKRLTAREEEIMGYFWTKGPLFVKQLLEFYDEPRPHFNTLSTKKASEKYQDTNGST